LSGRAGWIICLFFTHNAKAARGIEYFPQLTVGKKTMSHSRNLVRQLIEAPLLVQFVQQLEPEHLVRLVRHIGVEDAADVIALVPSRQLSAIFDEAFWKNNTPGTAERFDPEEFALWLEILYEHSEKAVQSILAEMDDELLTLGMAENLLVVDYESISLRMLGTKRFIEDDLLDKVIEGEHCLEWGDFFIISKKSRAWDTLIAVLVDLDAEAPSRVQRILQNILYITTEYIEDNGGLYSVLSSGEMLESDLAAGREERKTARGFVSPESASAFLQLAQKTPVETLMAAKEHDYLTRAYFRTFYAEQIPPEKRQKTNRNELLASIRREMSEMFRQLKNAQVIESTDNPVLWPDHVSTISDSRPLELRSLFLQMAQDNPARYADCLLELNYLANVLVAAWEVDGRKMYPVDAATKTLELCNEGIKKLLLQKQQTNRTAFIEILMKESPVKLFQIGWNFEANG